ncbi:MAG TPA: DUF4838 domain-containing protein, partial [Abditibacteriaceae bacterium]|nr:DUF4838 domain-containing protein [Abditibacteriaceae bacterium]
MLKQSVLFAALLLSVNATSVLGAPVTLVSDGRPRASIVLSAEAAAVNPQDPNANQDLVHLRWAAEDLASYLRKMSGAEIPVGSVVVENHLPIYVGSPPETIKLTKSSEFGDAYMIDVSEQRIVLQGESSRAVYYAAAHLLESLGVRWYAPEEMGEHVPQRRTVVVQSGRVEEAPHFQTRHLWGNHPTVHRWLLRNRMGGPGLAQGHSFESYMQGGKFFEEHPEYYPVIGGKPVKTQANLSNPKVVEIFANSIAET